MRLWTIQTREVYESWQQSGVYRTDPAIVDADFRRAYDWLVGQMQERLPAAPQGCTSPIWAWLQAQSAARPRPDLRTGGYMTRGTRAVLLTLDIDPAKVLLSDFELWHYVLNDWYLPETFTEDDTETTPQERQRSWERIFDLDFAAPDVASPRAEKIIQATFWELRASQVKEVQEFTAR